MSHSTVWNFDFFFQLKKLGRNGEVYETYSEESIKYLFTYRTGYSGEEYIPNLVCSKR